ncbi:MAG: penicillin acylase family protein [Gemmatimonadetes bacterium]|nr:penicillin acylase family protein [Gemmatimonadota bacterium]
MIPILLLALSALQLPDSGAAISARVEIVRTEYGVPHVFAEDLKAMGFGLGYVQSQDFGASIAVSFVESRGVLARHEGYGEIESDFVARGVYERAVATYHQLDTRTQDVYEGFAEGLNFYIRLHASEFPAWIRPDFIGVDALARDVQSWSRADAARFVRALTRPGEAPAPEEEEEEALAFALDGSNAWAFDGSRTESGRAILLRNPHLAWATDAPLLTRSLGSTYYEAHVRVPGVIDFYGDFRIGGAFGIIGGFNRHLGWATTNNYPAYSQVYALEAHPTLADHAVLDGAPLALTQHTTSVDYATSDGGSQAESRSRWTTEYGPVIHRTSDRVYVLKDPRDGEFRRGEQFLKMMLSESLDEWLEVMHMRAHPSSNFTYADAAGNIVHYFNARLPLLPHEMTGDSAAFAASAKDIWSRLVPWDDLPLYLNPPGGYVSQTNDTPDYTNLNVPLDRDTVAANLPEPRLRLRSQLSLDLAHKAPIMSLEDVVRLKHSPRMLMAERVLDDLLTALRSQGAAFTRPIAILENWDRTASVESRGGVLFKRWAEDYFSDENVPGLWAQAWDIDRPAETPLGLGNQGRAREAMVRAVASLERDGTDLDARWGDVHRVIRGSVNVPVAGCEPTLGCFRALSYSRTDDGQYAANRGDAWILVVEFGDIPRAYAVLSYGQTAREESDHFADQAAMFARGELKAVAWTDEDIRLKTIDRYRPGQEIR